MICKIIRKDGDDISRIGCIFVKSVVSIYKRIEGRVNSEFNLRWV